MKKGGILIKASKLKKGDMVGICAPSGMVEEKHKKELEKRLGCELNFEKASDLADTVIFQYVFLKEKPGNQILTVTPEHEGVAVDTLRKIIRTIMEYNVDRDVNQTLVNMNKGLGVMDEYTRSNCVYCQYAKHCRYKIENGENAYPKSL